MATWSRIPHAFVAFETPTDAIMNSLPKGVIAHAENGSDVSGITTTEVEVLNTGALTVPASRMLRATINLYIETATTDGLLVAVFLRESAGSLHVFHEHIAVSTGTGHRSPTYTWTFPAGSTTPTYSVGVTRENSPTSPATGTIIIKGGSQLVIEDVGPSA